jgi:RimJ/RimL family protein N-acetyltransferase
VGALGPDQVLSDGVVTLRRAEDRDLPAIEAGITDPDVVRWIGAPEATPEGVLVLNAERAAAGSPTFAICGPDDACVGLVWVNRRAKDPEVGYVGYWLLPGARGRGLATKAVRLISDWAFQELGLTSLGLTADVANVRSRAVAERSGFRRAPASTGDAAVDDQASGNVFYTLDRDADAAGHDRGPG